MLFVITKNQIMTHLKTAPFWGGIFVESSPGKLCKLKPTGFLSVLVSCGLLQLQAFHFHLHWPFSVDLLERRTAQPHFLLLERLKYLFLCNHPASCVPSRKRDGSGSSSPSSRSRSSSGSRSKGKSRRSSSSRLEVAWSSIITVSMAGL